MWHHLIAPGLAYASHRITFVCVRSCAWSDTGASPRLVVFLCAIVLALEWPSSLTATRDAAGTCCHHRTWVYLPPLVEQATNFTYRLLETGTISPKRESLAVEIGDRL